MNNKPRKTLASNMMKYKGYISDVEFDSDARMFHGSVVNTKDVITFQSSDATQLETEMHNSIDIHLAFCEKKGIEPIKPFSGQFVFRTSPVNHGLYHAAAAHQKISLNKWADSVMEAAAHQQLGI